ncbi:MAG: hypothetical protein ABI723_10205 [Bacteroidia bacterium]
MLKKHTFWLKVTVFFQLFTASAHSLSFINKPVAQNETEKQLIDLMNDYKMEMGAGFTPSMHDLFTGVSAGFTLLFILGGLINWFLLKVKADNNILNGIININLLVYGICFIVNFFFTFIPPIICTGLIFLSLILARLTFSKTN